MNEHDLELWCDETLPELYDEGMFDSEEISEDVWASVETALTLLEDLTDEDHVGILAEGAADGLGETGHVDVDLALGEIGRAHV